MIWYMVDVVEEHKDVGLCYPSYSFNNLLSAVTFQQEQEYVFGHQAYVRNFNPRKGDPWDIEG